MSFYYRIKQFCWALNAHIGEKEANFIMEYLNPEEYGLFMRLSSSEQMHSIRVAKNVQLLCENNECDTRFLIKTALLHDIGKVRGRLNVFDKSVIVLLNYFTRGKIKKYNRIRKIDIYYNHGDIGCSLLKEYSANERMLYLIKNHHDEKIQDDEELNILRVCDNKN
jgi:putative nucleotidyltransferase with HDIG domain